MRLAGHLLAAPPLCGAVLLATGSIQLTVIAAVSSVLIDLDHIPDYVIERRGWKGLGDFFLTCHAGRWRRIFILLHSWELPILAGLGFAAGVIPPMAAAVAFGMTYHLALDAIGNRPLTVRGLYWFCYRAFRGFAANKLLNMDKIAKMRAEMGLA